MKKRDATSYEKMFTDVNELFVGDELDQAKLDKLNRLRDLCREIAETEEGIRARVFPFSNANRNGMAGLDFRKFAFCSNRKVMRTLAQVLASADDFSLSAADDGVRMCFGIHDMWEHFHYDGCPDLGK